MGSHCLNVVKLIFISLEGYIHVVIPKFQTQSTFISNQIVSSGGDQGLLNMYFHDWATKDINKHLPFIYNVVSQAFYSYLPAFR